MLAIGHPILGDFFYGQQRTPDMHAGTDSLGALPAVNSPDDVAAGYCNAYERADRLLLHAEELCILHPRTGVEMAFRAACPFTLRGYY